MRRNVLHLIDTGGPGGAETIYLELVTRLSPAAWTSTAVVPLTDWLSGALEARGVDPIVLPSRRAFDVAYVKGICDIVRKARVDLIHAHLLSTSVYGSLAGALMRVPLVCTFHGQVDVSDSERFLPAKFRIIDRRANHVTFVSSALRRDVLSRMSLKRARTHVVPNGIDLDAFRSDPSGESRASGGFRSELGVGPDEVLIGAVGNVRPSKAYDVLLRSVAKLLQTGRKCRVVVVGQREGVPGLYEGLVTLQADLGLADAVEFVGFRDDIPRVMRGLDVYVCSSHAEGFSLTTVQAMAMGLPVVATQCGGPEEIVTPGETGTLVPTNSPDALAHALASYIDDASMREATGARARSDAVSRYGVDAMVRGYERVYAEALDFRPAGSR